MTSSDLTTDELGGGESMVEGNLGGAPSSDGTAGVAAFIEVEAGVRYWEDATVNGKEDVDGTLIPGRDGDAWRALINLETGALKDWPSGVEASIHYKVCDAGWYWLTDAEGGRLAKWRGDYVPNDFLCHGDTGYGDYIIMDVGGDGRIVNFSRPWIKWKEWQAIKCLSRDGAPPQNPLDPTL